MKKWKKIKNKLILNYSLNSKKNYKKNFIICKKRKNLWKIIYLANKKKLSIVIITSKRAKQILKNLLSNSIKLLILILHIIIIIKMKINNFI